MLSPAINLYAVADQSNIISTTIKGTIHLDDSVELTIGIYQNPLVEFDPFALYKWKNIDSQYFEFSLPLDAPEIIEFYVNDKHRYRFYITPGSMNTINIEEDSYSVESPTRKENEILQKFGFNKAALKMPSYSNKGNLPLCLSELNNLCDSLDILLAKEAFSEDFKKYITSEMFGYRYFWKSDLLYNFKNDTMGIDTLPEEIIEDIHSLFKFSMQDEVRSRYYLNAVSSYFRSLLNLSLSPREEANYALYTTASFNTIYDIFNRYPALKGIFVTSAVNTAMYLAKTQEDIELAIYWWTYYSDHLVHQEKAFAVIKAELDRKIVRLKLNKLENYSLLNQRDSLVPLSTSLLDGVNIIAFWASWCQPCIEKMPELKALSKNLNVNLVFLNIWSSKSSWVKLFDPSTNQSESYLFADKVLSNKIAEQCSITQFPLYLIVDYNLNVLAINDSYAQLVDWISAK